MRKTPETHSRDYRHLEEINGLAVSTRLHTCEPQMKCFRITSMNILIMMNKSYLIETTCEGTIL